MSSLRPITSFVLAFWACIGSALAEQTALSRVESGAIRADAEGLVLQLTLTQRAPWRVFVLDEPRRLALDLMYAEWSPSVALDDAEIRRFDADWSRLTLPLDPPMVINATSMEALEDGFSLTVQMQTVSSETFAARAGAPADLQSPKAVRATPRARASDAPLRVMLDPGHGGFDPGAEAGGLVEADLMLSFARDLRGTLEEAGFDVALTREADEFVSLEARMSAARNFGADLLLSLHADTLTEGRASGATVYTLSEAARAKASQQLAERHDANDLIGGVDLEGYGEDVTLVLMDLVRQGTAPRSVALAESLLTHIRATTGHVSGRPQRVADFSVLRAPDFPSVLLELGFLSSETDRSRLTDPAWRLKTSEAIRDGLQAWFEADRAGGKE